MAQLLCSTYTPQRSSRVDCDCGRVDVCRQYLCLLVCLLAVYALDTCGKCECGILQVKRELVTEESMGPPQPPPLPVPISNGDEVLWLSVDRIKCLVRRASKTIKHTMLAKLLFSTYTAQRASRADFDCGRVDVCRQYLYLFVCSLPHYAYLTCFGACCTLNSKPQARPPQART